MIVIKSIGNQLYFRPLRCSRGIHYLIIAFNNRTESAIYHEAKLTLAFVNSSSRNCVSHVRVPLHERLTGHPGEKLLDTVNLCKLAGSPRTDPSPDGKYKLLPI